MGTNFIGSLLWGIGLISLLLSILLGGITLSAKVRGGFGWVALISLITMGIAVIILLTGMII